MKILHTHYDATKLKPKEIQDNQLEGEVLINKAFRYLKKQGVPMECTEISLVNIGNKPVLNLTFVEFESDEDRNSWLNATKKYKERMKDAVHIMHVTQSACKLLGSLMSERVYKKVFKFLFSLNESE